MFIGSKLRILVRLPKFYDVGRASVALRQAWRMLHFGKCLFVAHEDLRVNPADAGKRCELLDQVTEQVPAAPSRQNFIDGLERYILVKLLFIARIADASDLRTANYCEQVEIIERARCLRKGET